MTVRRANYEELDLSVRWLDAEHARHAYQFALLFGAKDRYGLERSTVRLIERHVIESYSVADAWLKERLSGDGTLQVVYGDDDVCVISAADFLDHWQRIFVPGRDDAVVLHNLNDQVIFYCHEEELEFGHRDA